MKTIAQHIKTIHEKPHHVRKHISFAAAAGITIVLGLIWLGSNLATNAFAIHASNFAESTGAESSGATVETDGTGADTSNLAGAAAVVPSANAPAAIEIVNTATSSPQKQAEQTVIPF